MTYVVSSNSSSKISKPQLIIKKFVICILCLCFALLLDISTLPTVTNQWTNRELKHGYRWLKPGDHIVWTPPFYKGAGGDGTSRKKQEGGDEKNPVKRGGDDHKGPFNKYVMQKLYILQTHPPLSIVL